MSFSILAFAIIIFLLYIVVTVLAYGTIYIDHDRIKKKYYR